MNNLRILRYGIQISRHKIFSLRTGSLMAVLLFFYYVLLSPLNEFTGMVDHNITPWILPCLLSNISFALVVSFCSIYFFSDVPFFQYHEMYQMIRCGRLKWAAAHLFSVVISSFFLAVMMLTASMVILLPNMKLSLEWGSVISTLSLTNAAEYIPFAIPYKLINHFTPVQAVLLSLLLLTLVIMFIGALMFAVSVLCSRIYAISAAVVVTVWAVIVYNMNYYWQQSLSYFSPISWLNIADIGTRTREVYTLPGYGYIFAALLALVLGLSVIVITKISTMDCNWVNEE